VRLFPCQLAINSDVGVHLREKNDNLRARVFASTVWRACERSGAYAERVAACLSQNSERRDRAEQLQCLTWRRNAARWLRGHCTQLRAYARDPKRNVHSANTCKCDTHTSLLRCVYLRHHSPYQRNHLSSDLSFTRPPNLYGPLDTPTL
jgi:hypothetical protein